MKEFGLLKLTAGDKTRTMNYTTKGHNDKLYVLTMETSKKIDDIRANHKVTVMMIKDKQTLNATANIITNRSKIKAVFDQMIKEDNSHFQTLNDQIVMIELNIE